MELRRRTESRAARRCHELREGRRRPVHADAALPRKRRPALGAAAPRRLGNARALPARASIARCVPPARRRLRRRCGRRVRLALDSTEGEHAMTSLHRTLAALVLALFATSASAGLYPP